MKQLVTDGDYTIKVASGGTLTIDTGNQIGQLYLTGDLVVNGAQTNVTSTNLSINDNIIVLNAGEAGAGITLNQSGIRIERGSLPDTQILFDETITWNDPVSQTIKTGAFTLIDEAGGNIGLNVRSIATGGGDLFLINAGTGVISVSGTNNYEDQVTDDDDIPNKAYVDVVVSNQVAAANFTRLRTGSASLTQIEVEDFETTGLPSNFKISVDDVNNVTYFANRTELHDLRITGSTIETTVSSADLILSAPGSGSVVIDDQLQILPTPSPDDASVDPSVPADGLKLYVKTPGVGKTGLYYVNSSSVQDELVSKNRSLLLSMIF
jgi:hypothetical protein|tara:strand:+ start:2139 stop:3107 length:969 start_codon:yes stop_codon:yes gene_type:complete